jgi:hypothetical protein
MEDSDLQSINASVPDVPDNPKIEDIPLLFKKN